MPFIKLNQPKYLSEGQYLISDTDPDSIYFNVSEVPDILTGGKNLFMLKGNKSLLAPGSTIEIEVTDLNGRPIYHENANYLEPGTKRRAVAIYVYDHTPQGGGVITITGTAQKRPNGKSVSLELQKTPNVKWQKKINVLPRNENTTRVILNRTPAIQIKELVKHYLVPEGGLTSGVNTVNAVDNGIISYTYAPANFSLDDFQGYAPSQIFQGYLSTTEPFFSSSMQGSEINFNLKSPASLSGVPNYPGPDTVEFMTIHLLGANTETFSPTIEFVENSTKAWITNKYQTAYFVSVAEYQTGQDQLVPATTFYDAAQTPTGFGPIHNAAGGGVDYSFTYQTPITWEIQTANSESYAKIDIAELDPICGDIKRLAIYKKSQGIQQWNYLTDVVLETKELLARDDAQGLTQNLGDFSTTAVVNTYWTGSFAGFSETAPTSPPIVVPDASVFINGVLVSGSEALAAATTNETRLDAYVEYRMKPSADWNGDGVNTSGVALKAGTSYCMTMKLASRGVPDNVSNPLIKIFASGSAIDLPSEDSTMRKFATITTPNPWAVVDPNDQEPTYFSNKYTVSPEELKFHFDVSNAGDMSVVFRITSGQWWISDVSIKPASQTGFTPNYTFVEIPMSEITQQNDIVDFKFELYDNIDNLVHTELTQSLEWAGSNVYINGDNNYIGGTLVVGEDEIEVF